MTFDKTFSLLTRPVDIQACISTIPGVADYIAMTMGAPPFLHHQRAAEVSRAWIEFSDGEMVRVET